ncbi:tyrosine-type recombinase/integrase [Sphingobium cupriresistens]|uniref:Integrase n=1 Tax=Sphingobium cupriresistens LL01 TaxID=1420583 RepID=A0A0J7XSS8_9SPHN|nr:site-specific integrase [Sphingobium cupriresistens]KMS54068.1 integrase [Sphingobium cupriresistens LL01]
MGSLTVLQVKAATKPGRYVDGEGLMLVVKPGGAKTWQLRIQANGKRRDYGLGSASIVSLADARERAYEMRKQVRAGDDPVALKEAARKIKATVPTFEVAARDLHEERKAGWRNGKHRDQWLSSLEAYAFPAIGSTPVDRVNVADIRDLLASIWLVKPETARRVLQRTVTVLDWAHAKGHRPSEAPVRAVRAGLGRQTKTDSHFLALPHDQVADLMKDLKESDTAGRLALRFLILTAGRSGEVRGAKWSEIDFDKALWTIPAERMKAKREHVVPLSSAALEVLRIALTLRRGGEDVVFPGMKGQPLSDMTLTKVLRVALPGSSWTVHGFRSSFRDWCAECTGYRSEVAESALAHTIPNKVEAAYRRTNYLQLRTTLMADWAVYLGEGPVTAIISPKTT